MYDILCEYAGILLLFYGILLYACSYDELYVHCSSTLKEIPQSYQSSIIKPRDIHSQQLSLLKSLQRPSSELNEIPHPDSSIIRPRDQLLSILRKAHAVDLAGMAWEDLAGSNSFCGPVPESDQAVV